MKSFKELLEIKITKKEISGDSGFSISTFDSEFKNKKLKKKIQLLTANNIWEKFPTGSLVSNLKGGIFVKTPNDKSKFGIQIISNKENMKKIINAV